MWWSTPCNVLKGKPCSGDISGRVLCRSQQTSSKLTKFFREYIHASISYTHVCCRDWANCRRPKSLCTTQYHDHSCDSTALGHIPWRLQKTDFAGAAVVFLPLWTSWYLFCGLKEHLTINLPSSFHTNIPWQWMEYSYSISHAQIALQSLYFQHNLSFPSQDSIMVLNVVPVSEGLQLLLFWPLRIKLVLLLCLHLPLHDLWSVWLVLIQPLHNQSRNCVRFLLWWLNLVGQKCHLCGSGGFMA